MTSTACHHDRNEDSSIRQLPPAKSLLQSPPVAYLWLVLWQTHLENGDKGMLGLWLEQQASGGFLLS